MEFILPKASHAASPSSTELRESVSHSKSGELLSSRDRERIDEDILIIDFGLQLSIGYCFGLLAELTSFTRSGRLIAATDMSVCQTRNYHKDGQGGHLSLVLASVRQCITSPAIILRNN